MGACDGACGMWHVHEPSAKRDSAANICGGGALKNDAASINCSSWQCGSVDKISCCQGAESTPVNATTMEPSVNNSIEIQPPPHADITISLHVSMPLVALICIASCPFSFR